YLPDASQKENKKESAEISTSSTNETESLNATEVAVAGPQAAETSTNTVYDNIDTILNSKNNNLSSAFQQLFKTWDQQYNKKTYKTACKQAASHSLSCLYRHGNLNSLKEHDRPAVLTLVNKQGKTRYVTITSIDNDIATIYSNNTAYTVKLSDLDKYWHGKFILLWQKPMHYLTTISPGDSGSIINWLNTQLEKTNNHLPEKDINIYNDNLVKKVIAFQSQHGLTADGIVGPITIIHLNTQSGKKAPSLVPPSSLQLTKQG
ncbi:MAG: peptidoglycan-binding protein, partial [Gammaproteobacteria bacterium]